MRRLNLQLVEHAPDVVARAGLRVPVHVVRYVRGMPTAGIEGDAAIPAREEPDLKMPARGLTRELVHEDQRRSRSDFLVVEIGTATGGCTVSASTA